jgi:hypothetical protein
MLSGALDLKSAPPGALPGFAVPPEVLELGFMDVGSPVFACGGLALSGLFLAMAKINAGSVVAKVVVDPPPPGRAVPGTLRVHTHAFFGAVDPTGVPVEAFPGAPPLLATGGGTTTTGGGEGSAVGFTNMSLIKVVKFNAGSAGMVTFLPEGSQVHMVVDSAKGKLTDRDALVSALARSCGEVSNGSRKPSRGSEDESRGRADKTAALKHRKGKRK